MHTHNSTTLSRSQALHRIVASTTLGIVLCLSLASCQPDTPIPYTLATTSLQVGEATAGGDSLHYSANIRAYQFDGQNSTAAQASNRLQTQYIQRLLGHKQNWDPQELAMDGYLQLLAISKLEQWRTITSLLGPEANDCTSCRTMEVHIDTAGSYQTSKLLCTSLSAYLYEGGANGQQTLHHQVVQKSDGLPLSYDMLVKDEAALLRIAEQAFRQQISEAASAMPYEEFWFKDGKFVLPRNFTFDSQAIVFTYNPYEIAPHSFGCITLRLPLESVKAYLRSI